MNNKKDKFLQGYMCAVAVLIKAHGDSTYVDDIFNACSKTYKELVDAGVDEFDLKVLKPYCEKFEKRKNLWEK